MRDRFKKAFKSEVKRKNLILYIITFGIIGAAYIVSSSAAPTQELKAAPNPKAAMGVSGAPASSFARWLDRDNIQEDIKFGETNKHFNSSGIDQTLLATKQQSENKVKVITINPVPDQTAFVPDRTKNTALCGKIGTSDDAKINDYKESSATYNGQKMAFNNLGNAKVDKNANGIRDNIENLYRASKGCYDLVYQHIADSIIKHKAYEYNPDGSPRFIIRFGHEFDGDFYEWGATNQSGANTQKALDYAEGKNAEQLYKEVWQRAHTLVTNRVKAAAPSSKIYWEFNSRYRIADGNSVDRLARIYPGDQYVDVIGIDFYDRNYSSTCGVVAPGAQEVPDCRPSQQKTDSWAGTEKMLDIMSDFAASRGKLIGVSEQHGSTAQTNKNGVKYWEDGADNSYYVQKVYDWVKKETTQRGRLAYIVFFERNGETASKELGSNLGAEGLKSIHKLTPGATNDYQLPAGNQNATCALEWQYDQLDANGNPIAGATPLNHKTRFPNAAKKFLQLWSGPVNNETQKSNHPNCIKIGVGGGENPNTPPSITLTNTVNATTGVAATLTASVTDDGKPAGSALSYQWTKSSGPGTVTFSNVNQKTTNVTFATAGVYSVKIAVSDSALTSEKSINVTVVNQNTDVVGDQFTLFDQTITHEGTAFTKITTLGGPTNWESPNNFKDGAVYARLDVSSMPATNERQLLAQVCLFRDGINQQTCSGSIPFSGESVTYAQIGTPSSADWFKKGSTWDFTTAIESARIQIKDAETGKTLLTANCGTSCSTPEIVNSVTPITLNMQVVVVAKDANIEALPNWLSDSDCPIEFGCEQEVTIDTPPVVRFNNATTRITKEGNIGFNIAATDDTGISRVELYRNGSLTDTLITSPYNVTLDTNSIPNGNYSYRAVAFDLANNQSESQVITVKIRNPNIDRIGKIDVRDLSILISKWNNTNDPTNDLDDSGKVDINDLTILISKWNQ